jgi:hypothetical protein
MDDQFIKKLLAQIDKDDPFWHPGILCDSMGPDFLRRCLNPAATFHVRTCQATDSSPSILVARCCSHPIGERPEYCSHDRDYLVTDGKNWFQISRDEYRVFRIMEE